MSAVERLKALPQRVAALFGEESSRYGAYKSKKKAISFDFDAAVLSNLLPYESMDEETGLFINRDSIGMGFVLLPCVGADESLVQNLSEMIASKIPETVEMHCSLWGHQRVGQRIDRLFQSSSARGRTKNEYHKEAAIQGYDNFLQLPAMLRDYLGFFYITKPRTNREGELESLNELRAILEAQFQVARIGVERLSLDFFLKTLSCLISPSTKALYWPEVHYEANQTLNEQIDTGGALTVYPKFIDFEDADDEITRVVSLGLTKLPDEFALWMTPDNFCNVFKKEKAITCPFIINVHAKVLPQHQSQGKANRKYLSLEKKANSAYAKYVPGTVEATKEWGTVREQLNSDTVHLTEMLLSVTLFTTPDNALLDTANAKACFKANGIEMRDVKYLQLPYYLSLSPFMGSDSLIKDFKAFKKVKTVTDWNLANFLPVVAEFKGSPEGFLLPTFRHQLCAIDNFDDKHLPITNYNMLIAASSGSGKSVLMNALIDFSLNRGDQVFVIDIGGSYKKLGANRNAAYIDIDNLALNFFTLFDYEESSEIDGKQFDNSEIIRDLLAVMASPNGNLPDVERAWLLEAANSAWKKRGRATIMDDVIDALWEQFHEQDKDIRLRDLITLLQAFSTEGQYGRYFNCETPDLSQYDFVILELGGLDEKPHLMTVTILALIAVIRGQFYQGDKTRRKLCLFDEAWQFIINNTNAVIVDFIQKGFRTARKHNGSYAVVTQGLEDFTGSISAQAIYNCSEIKWFMRQGNGFDDYIKANPDAFSMREQTLIKGFGEAKNNGFAEMMVKVGSISSFHRLFLDPFSRILFSSNAGEVKAVDDLVRQGLSLNDAVSHVAERLYGKRA